MKAVVFLGIALCLFVAGCVSSADQPSVSPIDTEWTLAELNGTAVNPGPNVRVPTLKLESATKRVSGNSGVNRYSGGYEMEGPKLKFGSTMGTRMAGPPEAMALEKDFLAALEKVAAWRATQAELQLTDGKTVLMKFRKG